MITCATCGTDVTGKKFCPQCGTPVPQPAPTASNQAVEGQSICPRCNGTVRPGAAFCMHCGAALRAQTPAPPTPVPQMRVCPGCYAQVPAQHAFCTNCGRAMNEMAPAPAPRYCPQCGQQNQGGARFCATCGAALTATSAPPSTSGPYPVPPVPSAPYPAYGQGQPQVPQTPQTQYGPPSSYPAPSYTGQPGYPGQVPMVLRCPVCWAISPLGTSNCPGCHTSLAGVAPTPATAAPATQQGGGGGFLQGNAGKYAMGALGGAAAVIGGEMLLHGVERSLEGDDYGYRHHHHHEGGALGDIGKLADDIGLI